MSNLPQVILCGTHLEKKKMAELGDQIDISKKDGPWGSGIDTTDKTQKGEEAKTAPHPLLNMNQTPP